MKQKQFIIDQLIAKHGIPDDINSLNEYVDFVFEYKLEIDDYCEMHHTLTKSQFPEFSKEHWNIVKLLYKDHIKAHELLFKSFNLRTYQRPLNYMKSLVGKDFKMVSNAVKKGWKNLKENEEKYSGFREKRANHMRSLTYEEQSRRSHISWDSYNEEEYNQRCKINKENWTDDRKIMKSEQMKEYFKNNPEEQSRRSKKFRDSLSDEEKNERRKKQEEINKNPEKRIKAGNSIKKKWTSLEFKEKMSNRKKRGPANGGYLCISPDEKEYFFTYLKDVANELNTTEHIVRKNTNTNQPISFLHKKNEENYKHILGWKIFTSNYKNI